MKDLSATPKAISLPGVVTLEQTLQSMGATETSTVVYLLDGAHNVWFRREDKLLTKCLRFEATIDPAGTPLRHALTLVEGSGQEGMSFVQIDASVETPSGIPLETAVGVSIE
jgi:hypothetical protein